MILTYTVTAEDRRGGRRIYDSALAPGRWLVSIAGPLSFASLGIGVYSYVLGRRDLAFALFLSFAYLLGKGFLARIVRDFFATRGKPAVEHFQLAMDERGITIFAMGGDVSSGLVSPPRPWPWSEFRGYCDNADMFVLAREQAFYVIPKRSLTTAQVSEFQAVLRSQLRRVTLREGIRYLRHALSLVLLSYISFFFFGGTIQRGLWWVIESIQPQRAVRLDTPVEHPQPAASSQLHGFGQVYVVPIGGTAPLISPALVQYYRNKYGLALHVLAAIPVPEWARDEPRRQLVADELIEAMKRAYPQHAVASDDILIGVTDEDMYVTELDWKFALNFRESRQAIVISTARLNPTYYGLQADPELLESRFRKLLTKNIGITHFGLELTGDRGSVLYNDIDNMRTLDAMGEDYSVRDARMRRDRRFEEGDPCLAVRHFNSPEKQRADSISFTECSSTHGQTDLETLNVYLHYGILLSRRTDFYLPGPVPLELSRVLRSQDSRSRAFGIGGNHSLNIWPVGNKWPFSWMDLIFEDGGRLHYRRCNWGASYWDATYVVESTISDFYSSYVTWNWPGWRLSRQDGQTYFFADGGAAQRPEQGALMGILDTSGHFVRLERAATGDLENASASDGRWIRFQYDPLYRVTEARASDGREVRYRYNPEGCLDQVEDSNHHLTKYGHQDARCLTGMVVDGREIWSARYDKADRVTELNVEDVGTYRFSYSLDPSGEPFRVEIKDPGNNAMRIMYSPSGYRLERFSGGNTSLAALPDPQPGAKIAKGR